MVEYKDPGPPAQRDDIERLEAQIGFSLPGEYRSYLVEQDGGWVKDNTLAVDEIFGTRKDVPSSGNIWESIAVYRNRVPQWLLPVASDVYGNVFAISLREANFGTVWFWDHEEEEADEDEPPTEENIRQVAPSWSIFLGEIKPITGND